MRCFRIDLEVHERRADVDGVIAGLGWVALIWLPGYLLSDVSRPAVSPLRHAAIGALVGAGLTMLVAQLWTWLGWDVRPATVLPLTLGLPVLLYCARRAHRGRRRGT